jgi:hypothetical protein
VNYARTRSPRRRLTKSSQRTQIDFGDLDSEKSLDRRQVRARLFARAKLIVERVIRALPGYGQKKAAAA